MLTLIGQKTVQLCRSIEMRTRAAARSEFQAFQEVDGRLSAGRGEMEPSRRLSVLMGVRTRDTFFRLVAPGALSARRRVKGTCSEEDAPGRGRVALAGSDVTNSRNAAVCFARGWSRLRGQRRSQPGTLLY